MKKVLIGFIAVALLLVGANSVIGATFKSPAEIYAEIKGISVEDAYAERNAGRSFASQAEDAGVSEEFRSQMLEQQKTFVQEKVIAGEITQEQADDIIANMEENIAYCNGFIGGRGIGFGERTEGYFGGGRGNRGGGCWGAQNGSNW